MKTRRRNILSNVLLRWATKLSIYHATHRILFREAFQIERDEKLNLYSKADANGDGKSLGYEIAASVALAPCLKETARALKESYKRVLFLPKMKFSTYKSFDLSLNFNQ